MDAIIKTLAGRKAVLTRFYGAEHPDTIEAARELAIARLIASVQAASAAGLDALVITETVKTGLLAKQVPA